MDPELAELLAEEQLQFDPRVVAGRGARQRGVEELVVAASDTDFAARELVDPLGYAAHGGAFPVIVRDVGVVGTVTVSGLPQADDHRLVVEVLRTFLADAGSPHGEPAF